MLGTALPSNRCTVAEMVGHRHHRHASYFAAPAPLTPRSVMIRSLPRSVLALCGRPRARTIRRDRASGSRRSTHDAGRPPRRRLVGAVSLHRCRRVDSMGVREPLGRSRETLSGRTSRTQRCRGMHRQRRVSRRVDHQVRAYCDYARNARPHLRHVVRDVIRRERRASTARSRSALGQPHRPNLRSPRT